MDTARNYYRKRFIGVIHLHANECRRRLIIYRVSKYKTVLASAHLQTRLTPRHLDFSRAAQAKCVIRKIHKIIVPIKTKRRSI